MDGAFNIISYSFCGLHFSSLSNSSPLHLSLLQHRHDQSTTPLALPVTSHLTTLLAPSRQTTSHCSCHSAHTASHHASAVVAEPRLGPTSLEQRRLPTVAEPHPCPHLARSMWLFTVVRWRGPCHLTAPNSGLAHVKEQMPMTCDLDNWGCPCPLDSECWFCPASMRINPSKHETLSILGSAHPILFHP